MQPCPSNCSNIGVCTADRCYCPAGFTGDACQTRVLSAQWARSARYGADTALMPPSVEGSSPTTLEGTSPNFIELGFMRGRVPPLGQSELPLGAALMPSSEGA